MTYASRRTEGKHQACMVAAPVHSLSRSNLLAYRKRAGHVEGSMLDQARHQAEGGPMTADILTNLWLGFLVILACGVLYGIRKLDRRQRMAKGELRLSRATNS